MKNMHKIALLSMVLAHGVAGAVSLPSLPSKQDVKDFVTSPKKMGITVGAIGLACLGYKGELYKAAGWTKAWTKVKSIELPKFAKADQQSAFLRQTVGENSAAVQALLQKVKVVEIAISNMSGGQEALQAAVEAAQKAAQEVR